jgi:mannobiose 2-epimerase
MIHVFFNYQKSDSLKMSSPNKSLLFLAFIFIFLSQNSCSPGKNTGQDQKSQLLQLKKEISEDLLENLLPYWSMIMPDTINGGFYGRVDASEQVYPNADKGGILNARILWTFSSAYRIFKDSSYLHMANYAKDYIVSHFLDEEYGGAYRTVNEIGEPADTRKHTLTESYFIYAFAEYYRATGDQKALDNAIEIFKLLEKHALDKDLNGYYEVFTRDWERSRDLLLNENSPEDEKTMITHLHLVEAYAGLYRVWPEKQMEERLRNVLELFINKIVDKETFHTIYFLDRNWNPTTQIDSYGHDIEGAWLIVEAARLLNDAELLEDVEKLSIKISNAAKEGLEEDGSMLTEKDLSTGHVVTIRSWWEQAESIVGYLNAYEITGDESYLDISMNSWIYIKNHFIDNVNGGWFSLVSESGEPVGRDKANYWTCPYHNGRMGMEVVERIQ